LLITVVVTLDPLILGYAGGQPDPVLETLAMCAMCVGYVRGLGYIPRQRGWQWVFSSAACYLSLALALLRMAANRN
jgi:predicted membrane protein